MRNVYLDNNATTAVDPRVAKKLGLYFSEEFGNASSIHGYGQRARAAVEDARRQVADVLGAKPSEIIFTSGGTEADNTAVLGVARRRRSAGRHVITTQIEHPAVLRSCEALAADGFEVTTLEVDRDGRVSVDAVQAAIRPDTILISVMHANNEVGSIQPLAEIGKLTREQDILFHSDAVQSVGKIPVDVGRLGLDLLSLSSHKLHGPKGVGALYAGERADLEPLLLGGSHERSRRAGTENVPGAVGLGEAVRLAADQSDDFSRRVGGLRDRLEQGILERVPDTFVNGGTGHRMPHVSNLSFLGVEGEALLIALDFQGIAVSTGAACSSGSLQPSHVLRALKLEKARIQSAIRFSLSRMTTEEDVDYVLEALPKTVARMRDLSLKKTR